MDKNDDMGKKEKKGGLFSNLLNNFLNSLQNGLNDAIQNILEESENSSTQGKNSSGSLILSEEGRDTLKKILDESRHSLKSSIPSSGNAENTPTTKRSNHKQGFESKFNDFTVQISVSNDDPTSPYEVICTGYSGTDETIFVPDGVTSIGERAFFQNEFIKHIMLPETLRKIQKQAFAGSKIVSVVFEDEVKSIDEYAFENCKNLAKIELPNSIRTLQKGVFKGCSSLEEVSLSTKLDGLPELCFEECVSLQTIKNIKLPDEYRYGRNIFFHAFRKDEHSYFEYDETTESCSRKDDAQIVPNCRSLDYPTSPLIKGFLDTLIQWICNSRPFEKSIIRYRAEILSACLSMMKIFTDNDESMALNLLHIMRVILSENQNKRFSDFDNDIHSALFYTMQSTHGPFRTELDNAVFTSYFRDLDIDFDEPFSMHEFIEKTGHIKDLIPDSYLDESNMLHIMSKQEREKFRSEIFKAFYDKLNIAITPLRYHPYINHYSAWFKIGHDPKTFILMMDSLLRGKNLDICQFSEVDTEMELDFSERIAKWSKAIYGNRLGILIFRLHDDLAQLTPDAFRKGDLSNSVLISLMDEKKAYQIYHLLKEYHFTHSFSFLYGGQDMFSDDKNN